MAGRKLKYKTPEEMQEAIEEYFKSCEGHILTGVDGQTVFDKFGNPIIVGEKPLTVTGLALALGFATRQSLLDYQGRKAFEKLIQTAKLRIENYAEMRLYDKDGYGGARFNLQNNFRNWDADKAIQDDKSHPAINIICDIPRVAVSDSFQQDMIDPKSVSAAIKAVENKNDD